MLAKMHANPFPTSNHRAKHPLELVHTDIHGPTPVQSHQGYKYWALFKDDYTRLRCVIPMKKKADTFGAFKVFKAFVENLFDCKIKTIRDDKGGEYMSKEFEEFCLEHGIERQHTTRNRPQQNGDAERDNRIFGERITAMLAESGLPPLLEVDLHSIGKYVSCSCLVPFLDMMLIIYMATLILSLSLFSFRTLSCYDIYGYPC